MREHQIVINLKPEQFQEVQRLARAAGSRSVSAFVRQKLLTSLGVDGTAEGDPSQADLKVVTNELKRLHRELQVFVAESLTANELAYADLPRQGARENFLTEGAPIMADPSWDYYGDEAAYGENAAPPPEVEPAAAFSEQGDELEDLADRAFAISPRLGATEPHEEGHHSFPDPLQELLQDAYINIRTGDQDDEELVDEQDDEAWLEESEMTNEAVVQYEEEEPTAEEAELSAYAAQVAEEEAEQEAAEEELQAPQTDDATDNIEDDEADDETPPPSRPPIPPFSGGPPPRRRPT